MTTEDPLRPWLERREDETDDAYAQRMSKTCHKCGVYFVQAEILAPHLADCEVPDEETDRRDKVRVWRFD